MQEVALIRWPAEAERLEALRRVGAPRLLLVERSVDPPDVADPLEDWLRVPAPEADVKARVRTLETRASEGSAPRVVDGVLMFNGALVTLSPVEERLALLLSDRFGSVVGRDVLMRGAWDELPSRNALDVHMLRLRRRIEPLGLEIRTVRSRGYLLRSAPDIIGS